jgi:hypothetical protein
MILSSVRWKLSIGRPGFSAGSQNRRRICKTHGGEKFIYLIQWMEDLNRAAWCLRLPVEENAHLPLKGERI